MFKAVDVLDVFYRRTKLGRLALTPEGICVFEYEQEWIKTGFSISPFYLPLKSGLFTARETPFEGLFGVFEDSLPDGWGKLLIDRWLKAKGENPALLSSLDRLSLVGSSGMGALTYKPAQNSMRESDVQSLNFYAAEVEKVLNEDYTGALDDLVNKAGSSGGARPKVLLTIDGEEWLIKFRSSVDPLMVGQMEYGYSQKALQSGIIMPETRLFEGKYFGVKRFDRNSEKTVHMHSAAGLLYASHRLPSLDYVDLLKATFILTKNMLEVEKLFRLMVFNVLIGNMDDHAKNFSFLYIDDHWELSPGYDLLPSDGFHGNHSTTINGKGRPGIKDCFEVAEITNITARKAKQIIREVQDGLKLESLKA